MISLDSYFSEYNLKKIDLIKIDTEGFEYEVLQGLQKKYKKCQLYTF